MQNDFLTKLKITCIRIISFSQKNNFQSINEYYPLVSNFRIKQNFDRTKLRIIRITRFLPAVNPSIIVCREVLPAQKFRPWSVSRTEREKKWERERELEGWGGRFPASLRLERGDGWKKRAWYRSLRWREGEGPGGGGDKEAGKEGSRVSEPRPRHARRLTRGERTTVDAKIPPRSVHPYRYTARPSVRAPRLTVARPAHFAPTAARRPTFTPTTGPKSPTRPGWLDSGTGEPYLRVPSKSMSRVEKQLDRKESCSLSIVGPLWPRTLARFYGFWFRYWSLFLSIGRWNVEKGGFVSSLLPVRKRRS